MNLGIQVHLGASELLKFFKQVQSYDFWSQHSKSNCPTATFSGAVIENSSPHLSLPST